MKYLILDAEFGSRHSTSSLLTAYFLVTDQDFNPLGELDLKLKPESDEHYILDAQGMAVNKINIVEHDKVAITCKQAKPLLYEFLKIHAAGGHLTPVGHAVKSDIQRITDKLISVGSWEQFCTYHFIDTSVVLQFLRACGKMPMDCDGSVEALAKYFVLAQAHDNWHNAEFDTKITALILKKFIELGK